MTSVTASTANLLANLTMPIDGYGGLEFNLSFCSLHNEPC
jgi:hypothetical protein